MNSFIGFPASTVLSEVIVILIEARILRDLMKQLAFAGSPLQLSWVRSLGYSTVANLMLLFCAYKYAGLYKTLIV